MEPKLPPPPPSSRVSCEMRSAKRLISPINNSDSNVGQSRLVSISWRDSITEQTRNQQGTHDLGRSRRQFGYPPAPLDCLVSSPSFNFIVWYCPISFACVRTVRGQLFAAFSNFCCPSIAFHRVNERP